MCLMLFNAVVQLELFSACLSCYLPFCLVEVSLQCRSAGNTFLLNLWVHCKKICNINETATTTTPSPQPTTFPTKPAHCWISRGFVFWRKKLVELRGRIPHAHIAALLRAFSILCGIHCTTGESCSWPRLGLNKGRRCKVQRGAL